MCYENWLATHNTQHSGKQHLRDFPQGEVMARIMGDTLAIRELLTSGTFGIFIDIFFVISCLGSFITLNFLTQEFLFQF